MIPSPEYERVNTNIPENQHTTNNGSSTTIEGKPVIKVPNGSTSVHKPKDLQFGSDKKYYPILIHVNSDITGIAALLMATV